MNTLINIKKPSCSMLYSGKNASSSGWEAECSKTISLWLHQLTCIVQETWRTMQQTEHLYRNLPRCRCIFKFSTILRKNPKLSTGKVKQSINGSNVVRHGWVLRNSTSGKRSFLWAIMQCTPVLTFSTDWSDKLTKSFCPTSESNQTDPSPSWLVSLQVLISKQTNL